MDFLYLEAYVPFFWLASVGAHTCNAEAKLPLCEASDEK